MKPPIKILASICSVALLMGCAQPNQHHEKTNEDPLKGTDPALAQYYEQDLTWGECENLNTHEDIECADLTVPLDYNNPDGETTTLAVSRVSSTKDAPGGALIINPGGPGGSGVDYTEVMAQVLDPKVQEKYTLVSFDPRGVSRSDGIECLTDKETDKWREQDLFKEPEKALKATREEYKKLGESCREKSGALLDHMDTHSVARDLDIIRGVLGSPKTNYIGLSYGTSIGAIYAEIFPDNIGRFVLDGAVDPSLNLREAALDQARGFDASLQEFLRECTENNDECFTDGSVDDGLAEIEKIIQHTESEKVTTTGGRVVTSTNTVEGILVNLYNPKTGYERLNSALVDAKDGDYSALLALSDWLNSRGVDGSYKDNATFALTAVKCLDTDTRGVSDAEINAAQKQLEEEIPTFGKYLGYTDAMCQQWPAEPVGSAEPATYEGDREILVIGTSHDPATPYHWAEALTEQLGNARLLKNEGWAHAAFPDGKECIDKALTTYLLDDRLPAEGTVCS